MSHGEKWQLSSMGEPRDDLDHGGGDGDDARDLYLRIAPELQLKQLVAGGLHRVYELGRQFRNEGVDATHNPEFTTCEAYEAMGTYERFMALTERLFGRLAERVGNCSGEVWTGGEGSFARVEFTKALEEATRAAGSFDFGPSSWDDEAAIGAYYTQFLRTTTNTAIDGRGGAGAPQAMPNAPKMLDIMFSELVEPHLNDMATVHGQRTPIFVVDHPIIMSPLAKRHHDDGNGTKAALALSERFELYSRGMELCNAYTELTDPREQQRRMEHQLAMRRSRADDDSLQRIDGEFLDALESGMPPTAGWGLGVDRVVMVLVGAPSIRDVMAFPLRR